MNKIHPPRFLSSNVKFGKNNKLSLQIVSDDVLISTETWVEDPDQPHIDDQIVTAKKGFQWITTWELNKHFISTKIMDDNNKLVGTYWDITSLVKKVGELFEAYDWYLDVFKTPDKTKLLDEDELHLAVEQGFLSEKEASIAAKTANEIISLVS